MALTVVDLFDAVDGALCTLELAGHLVEPEPPRRGAGQFIRRRGTSRRLPSRCGAGAPQRVRALPLAGRRPPGHGRRLLWLDRPTPSLGHAATATRCPLGSRPRRPPDRADEPVHHDPLRHDREGRQPDRARPRFPASRRHSRRVVLIRRHAPDSTAPAPGRSADGRPCRRRPQDRRRQRADPRPRFVDRLHWRSGRGPTTSDPDHSSSGRDPTTSDPGHAHPSRVRCRRTDSWNLG